MAAIFQWQDMEKLIYGRRLLQKIPKKFVNSELKPRTWISLKNGLIREFERETNSAVIHRLLETTTKKNAESYSEYFYRMIDIAAPIKMDPKGLITYIIDGISDVENHKIVLHESNTVEELKRKLQNFEEIKKSQQARLQNKTKNDKTQATRLLNNRSQPTRSNTNDMERGETSSRNVQRNLRCFNCGSNRHQIKNCPKKDQGPKCYTCNEYGHLSPTCPNRDTAAKTNKTSNVNVIVRTRVEKEIFINGSSVEIAIRRSHFEYLSVV